MFLSSLHRRVRIRPTNAVVVVKSIIMFMQLGVHEPFAVSDKEQYVFACVALWMHFIAFPITFRETRLMAHFMRSGGYATTGS